MPNPIHLERFSSLWFVLSLKLLLFLAIDKKILYPRQAFVRFMILTVIIRLCFRIEFFTIFVNVCQDIFPVLHIFCDCFYLSWYVNAVKPTHARYKSIHPQIFLIDIKKYIVKEMPAYKCINLNLIYQMENTINNANGW